MNNILRSVLVVAALGFSSTVFAQNSGKSFQPINGKTKTQSKKMYDKNTNKKNQGGFEARDPQSPSQTKPEPMSPSQTQTRRPSSVDASKQKKKEQMKNQKNKDSLLVPEDRNNVVDPSAD